MRAITMIMVLAVTVVSGIAVADEAPISGTVKAVDPAAPTVTIEATAKHEGDREVADVVKMVLEQ